MTTKAHKINMIIPQSAFLAYYFSCFIIVSIKLNEIRFQGGWVSYNI